MRRSAFLETPDAASKGASGVVSEPASPITLHGHRRPRLYRGGRLAQDWTPCQEKSGAFLKRFNVPAMFSSFRMAQRKRN
jgi:hypothetical protein